MGDVVDFDGETVLPIPVERICEQAKSMESVAIVGIDSDGCWTLRTSSPNIGSVLLALHQGIQIALEASRGD